MKITKCDRCGIEITPKPKNVFEQMADSIKKTFVKKEFDLMLINRTSDNNRLIDLCDECKASLDEWYKRGGEDNA